MAPFNHFGADLFITPPPVATTSRERGAAAQRRDGGSISRQDSKPSDNVDSYSSDTESSTTHGIKRDNKNKATVDVTKVASRNNRKAPIKGSRLSRILSSDTTSQRSRQGRAKDITDGSDAPTSGDSLAEKGKGFLGSAISGVASAVGDVVNPILDIKSSATVAAAEPTNASVSAPTAIATTANEPTAAAASSSEPSSAAAVVPTVNPTAIDTTAKEQPSALASSARPIVVLPDSSNVLSPTSAVQSVSAGATSTPTRAAAQPVIPTSPEATVTPAGPLQSADRVSLGNNQPTGGISQKAHDKPDDSVVPGGDSDDDSGDDSDDDHKPDGTKKDDPSKTQLVAFTTISGTPLSTPLSFLDPTVVANLPASVTSVSQSGGPTVAAASAHKPLTSQASNGLIAFGAVGGVLLFSFVLYILIRLRKTDALSCLKCCYSKRKTESIASKSLYDESGPFGAPKIENHSRGFSAFFNPMMQIRAAEYSSTNGMGKRSSQSQPYSRNSLMQNAAPISKDGATPPLPVLPPSYRQSVKTQRESELSSLSSGFGDAIIDIPESGPTIIVTSNSTRGLPKLNQQTLGLDLGPRFSWANVPTPRTLGEHRNRDTTTTTASRDSAPRFRTVTSWVDQQTNRVLKNQDSGGTTSVPKKERVVDTVPDLPAIPAAYAATKHKRMPSEETDVVFKAHPGDEVEIKEGSRIPSQVLTRKLRL